MPRMLTVALLAALGLSACGEKQPEVIIDPPPPSNAGPADEAAPPAPAANAAVQPPGPTSAATAAESKTNVQAPRRKPGLWRLTASNGETTTVATLCVTQASEARVNAFDTRRLMAGPRAGQGGARPGGAGPQGGGPRAGGFGGGAQCQPQISKTGAGWQGRATCTREVGEGSMQIVVDEALSGDLQAKYTLKSRRTISGAPAAQMNRTINLTVEGVYQGACPSGQTGGDLIVDGRTVNLVDRS